MNRTTLEDLEQKVLALRALHAKLRELDAGESFGDIVARGRPKSGMLWAEVERLLWEGSVLEIRLRILDVRERETEPPSFLGIVEGFPEILVHATTVGQAERDLVNALERHFRRLMDQEATRCSWTTIQRYKRSVSSCPVKG